LVGIKNKAASKSNADQANCIEKPFHNHFLLGLIIVVERLCCMKESLYSQTLQYLSIFLMGYMKNAANVNKWFDFAKFSNSL